jgi:hypothetical protein
MADLGAPHASYAQFLDGLRRQHAILRRVEDRTDDRLA